MKYAIIGDIHGNLEAMEAVLRDMEQFHPDRIAVLGDNIDYGPNPIECLKRAYEIADILLMGNHELAAFLLGGGVYNQFGKAAISWQKSELSRSEEWKLLKQRMKAEEFAAAKRIEDGILFVHGSPKDPVEEYARPCKEDYTPKDNDRYLLRILESFSERHCFCSHTHVPALLIRASERRIMQWSSRNLANSFYGDETIFFVPDGNAAVHGLENAKAIINSGSVGQPRRLGDNRASYLIYDRDTVEFRRVEYDFRETQRKIMELPFEVWLKEMLAEKLETGR